MRLDDILLMTFAFIGIILLGIFGYIDYKDKVSWFLYNARYYSDLDKEDEDDCLEAGIKLLEKRKTK